jgi:signal transduction histidine kinase
VADSAFDEPLAEAYRAVLRDLTEMEDAIARYCEGLSDESWRPTRPEFTEVLRRLAGQITVIRRTIETKQQAQRDERRRLGHEMRGALNAIAGWTHILRLEKNPNERVARAADVLDRNVRALAVVVESTER